jgi:phosphatidylinositol alpha-1,6-mannosyltransferase
MASDRFKLLVLTDNFPPRVGGIANVVALFCRSFPPEQISVIAPRASQGRTIWDTGSNADAAAFDAAQRYRIRRIAYAGTMKKTHLTLLSLANLFMHALWAYWRDKCSLVVFGKVWPIAAIGPLLRRFGIRYVAYCHGSEVMDPFGPRKERVRLNAMLAADCVIANSAYTREYIIGKGVPSEQVVVIHPKVDIERFDVAVDVEAFKSREGIAGKRTILTVGRLMERKGQHVVIQAMRRVLDEFPDAVYVAVGVGPDRERLESLANELGVADHVRFPGDRNTLEFYHACDLFIMPSLDFTSKGDIESFGIVFLEANVCKKPVIGGRNCGMMDSVLDGETGLLVDPQNIDEVADAMLRLLRDRAFAEKLGRQGYERARREFSVDRYADDFRERVLPLL